MTTDASSPSVSAQPQSGNGLINFFANAITLVVFLLMALGIVAATAHWRSHTIEFVGSDRMRLTKYEWWGLAEDKALYRATPTGWVLIRENGDEVAVALQPIEISD